MAAEIDAGGELKRTPLHALHRACGGRMGPVAGYSMPVQVEGIIAEPAGALASSVLD